MNRQYALAALAALPFLAPSVAAQSARHQLDCGFLSTEEWRAELSAAVARGEIESPAQRPLPEIPNIVRRGRAAGYLGAIPCMTREQIFQYEDTNEILVGSFSTGELLDLMTEAANALMATHGDNYDFVGFWVNFVPDHKIGAAFYAGIENDVGGIGLDIENNRPDIGLAGDNVEGYIQMWNVNNSYWQPGTDATANFTRLALAQEFEHRFALFLPDLLDGRVMQGDNSGCGRGAHWNWQIDGQGSGMEISEWVGSSPAVPQGTFVTFNTDIPGGVFSYPDLYLMGYVTPAEMDAGVSELRFMEGSDCSSDHNGTISTFGSAEIIASAGARVPDSATAQQDFRTGWIMLHQPGDAPSNSELDKTVAILEQHMLDWNYSTLGRGTMDNTLFDDCNCDGVPDSLEDVNGNGVPDECEELGARYCTPAVPNSSGSPGRMTVLGSHVVADDDLELFGSDLPTEFNIGYFIMGTGMNTFVPPGSAGPICITPGLIRYLPPVSNTNEGPGSFQRSVGTAGPQSGLITSGSTWNFQAWHRDHLAGTSNLTDAVSVTFL